MQSRIWLGVLLCGRALAAADLEISRPSGEHVTQEQMVTELRTADIIVLGEEHYTPAVQRAQAEVIRAMGSNDAPGELVVGWEFLTASDQERVQDLFTRFVQGEMGSDVFLLQTQGRAAPSYAPILDATREGGGKIWATNLSRAERAPVAAGGISALAPGLLPPDFEHGGEFYRERFDQTMAGHAPPQKIDHYFSAQCLSDDVMALSLLSAPRAKHKILVTGSFHSDYRDGVVARLRKRAPELRIATLRFASRDRAPEFSDPRYGEVADFVVIVEAAEPPTP